MYSCIYPSTLKIRFKFILDLTDSETLEEEMVRGTSVRGGDKDGAGQRGRRSLKGKQGKVPISERYIFYYSSCLYAHQP